MSERLQKLLALAGVASRREIERWIDAGRIQVNGELAKLGDKASVRDEVKVDGKVINLDGVGRTRRVLVYNKPLGEVCTRNDPDGRPTVFDKLPKVKNERWINVGRLDINTSGLLLFTTDGELANKLMHPSSGIDREYAVRVRGEVDDEMIERLKKGVMLDDGMASFTDVQYFDGEGQNKWFHVVLMEGRNREVRRLWESQGIAVSRLKRVRYGCVFLPKVAGVGKWVEMGQKDSDELSKSVEMRTKPIKKLAGSEKESFVRQQKKQKVRQEAKPRRQR